MMANWTSHSGRQSTFAPASMRTIGPSFAGKTAAIAGRAIPSIVRRRISAIARNAPLFPAETTASASPSRTKLTATPRLVAAQRLGRRFVHRDRFRGVANPNALVPPNKGSQTPLVAHQDDLVPLVRRRQRPGDDLVGRVVPPHRVDRDPGHPWALPVEHPRCHTRVLPLQPIIRTPLREGVDGLPLALSPW